MAVVFCLPTSFAPFSPSPSLSSSSSSSSSSAPYSYSGAALNCRFRSDVMCEAGPAMTIASSSAASSFAPPGVTRSPNFCSAAAPSFCSQAGGGGKVHVYTGRLLSPSSSIAYRKSKGRNGFAFGEWSRVRSVDDQKREGRWTASPAKDSSRDVLTDPAEASRQRLTITRSGEEQQEEGAEATRNQSGELSEGKERLLQTDSSASEEEVSPATAASTEKAEDGGFGNTAAIGTVAAGLGLVIVLGGFGTVGYLYKDQLNEFLIQFSEFIEGYGPAGYGLFVLVYAGLEILAIPAIPLTMSAGLLFGAAIGTIIVSIAGTIAATGAFLIARYLARDRLLAFVKGNKKFLAIDKAIGDDGFRVVTLLRLSPLLPFSLGNYLYGLTSVQLGPYVLGSWLGMLPGSWAYVSAGAISRSFITKSENEQLFSGGPEQWWTLGLGLAATVLAATYVTKIAKEALKDIEE